MRDKVEMAQAYGRVRSFNPEHAPLVEMAKLLYMDVERVTTDLYERASTVMTTMLQRPGFLSYSRFLGTMRPRIRPRPSPICIAGAMDTCHDFDRNPHAKMETAVREVELA